FEKVTAGKIQTPAEPGHPESFAAQTGDVDDGRDGKYLERKAVIEGRKQREVAKALQVRGGRRRAAAGENVEFVAEQRRQSERRRADIKQVDAKIVPFEKSGVLSRPERQERGRRGRIGYPQISFRRMRPRCR